MILTLNEHDVALEEDVGKQYVSSFNWLDALTRKKYSQKELVSLEVGIKRNS